MNSQCIKVLLIEDNPGDTRLIKELFSECAPGSFELRCVALLSKGFAILESEEIDIILLDLSLPDSQGFETFIRVHDRTPEIPIIILTGFDDETLAIKAVKEGAQDYLAKGHVSRHLLARAARYAIERKRTEEALRKVRDELELRVQERTAELESANEELRCEIAERHRAEEAILVSEEKYRCLFEESRDSIAIITRAGEFLDINQAGLDLFGYTRSELMTKNISQLYVRPSDRKKYKEQIEREGSLRDYALRFLKKNGQEMDCVLTSTLKYSKDGNILGYQGIFRDVTEQKQMEEALQKSSEKIKLFAYSVSHDLKSPAISVYGLTKLLYKQYNESLDGKGQTYCEQILKSSEQIVALVEKINLYISTKEVSFLLERVNLERVLQIIKDEFSTRFSIRSIRWIVPDALPEIKADRLALLRILRNLVDNALKYGGDDLSKIVIGCEETSLHHIISVRDDGRGIGSEDSKNIFDLFQRKDEVKDIEGSGLGLAIVKEISEQHGGSAWVEPAPEKGSIFYVSISKR